MVTDHCTLLLAESALSHTSPATATSSFHAVGGANSSSQADSDINMPLEHLTPRSLPDTPQQDITANGIHGDSIHDNIITPTPLDIPKK